MRAINSGCPTAATACRTPMSVGRMARPRAGRPVAIAPEDTSTTWCPRSRAAASSPHSLASATSSGSPESDVIDDDPTFTTAVSPVPAVPAIR